jgi:acyl-CoA thioester hydrolase
MIEQPKHGYIATQPFYCRTTVQMRFDDIDALGHMHNSKYLGLFDLGRVDYFNQMHHEPMSLSHPPAMIAHLECDFLNQTVWGEPLQVLTQITHIGTKSFTMFQQLINSDTGQIKCTCSSVMVYLADDSLVPAPIPARWRDEIEAFERHPVE